MSCLSEERPKRLQPVVLLPSPVRSDFNIQHKHTHIPLRNHGTSTRTTGDQQQLALDGPCFHGLCVYVGNVSQTDFSSILQGTGVFLRRRSEMLAHKCSEGKTVVCSQNASQTGGDPDLRDLSVAFVSCLIAECFPPCLNVPTRQEVGD